MIKYITLEQILELHDTLIFRYGGLSGIRDINLLHSALEAPKASLFGNDMYPTIEEKAAAYLYHIVKNHAFNDANKRTGYSLFLIFLEMNEFNLSVSQKEIELLVLDVAAGIKNKEDITSFIKQNYSGGKAGTPAGGNSDGLTIGKVGPDNVNCPPEI
jgi:death-on-curing protein